jgi:hypothetical protein
VGYLSSRPLKETFFSIGDKIVLKINEQDVYLIIGTVLALQYYGEKSKKDRSHTSMSVNLLDKKQSKLWVMLDPASIIYGNFETIENVTNTRKFYKVVNYVCNVNQDANISDEMVQNSIKTHY